MPFSESLWLVGTDEGAGGMDFRAGLGNFEYPGPSPSRYEEEWPVMGKLGGTTDSNIIRPF